MLSQGLHWHLVLHRLLCSAQQGHLDPYIAASNALSNAVVFQLHATCRQPASIKRFLAQPASRPVKAHYATDEPAADIADSLLSNRWTAALVQKDSAAPELYCNSTALTRVGLGSWAPDAEPDSAHQQDMHPSCSQCADEETQQGANGTTAGLAGTSWSLETCSPQEEGSAPDVVMLHHKTSQHCCQVVQLLLQGTVLLVNATNAPSMSMTIPAKAHSIHILVKRILGSNRSMHC